jgi:glutathione S-transferase
MKLTALATLAALAVYSWTIANAAMARGKFKVKAPSMDGPPAFQSIMRVQANTLEALPLLLAPLWMCAWFLGDKWAAACGALWCVGRIAYALAYYKDPSKRTLGYVLSMTASGFLIVGTCIGLLLP